ncbi:Ser-Thr-rich glycosyl-phosphatidyl-inositol-anchored membrane family-domain-containing protein [Tuber brumale]|nr:Ser-Thr-rich glycosyl-phosphatidyl-inositol-anchored membrane family-domain-containing protein [Tuber brumale]
MRFLTSSLLAIAALATSVFAAENPISKPDGSSPLVAGETVTITWTPTTSGPITLKFRQGPSNDLKDVMTIVAGTDNSGSYSWTVPKDIPSGANYAIQIGDDKTTDVNYTPLLTVSSEAPTSVSSSSAAPSSTSSSSTSSSYASTTTSKAETTHKPAHNSTMITHTTSASNRTISTTSGPSNGTTTRSTGGSSSAKPTSSGSSGPSSSTGSSPPANTAPSSGAVSLVMNSPLALVVCVLGAVMYLN